MADERDRFMSRRSMGDAKERSPRKPEADDLDAKASKQVDGDVDEEDSSMLGDDAKAPPRRASVGWGTESTVASEEKGAGAESTVGGAAISSSATNEGKRGGRRRRGSDNASNSGGDGRNAKNRYFDEDGDSTDIQEIPDLEEEEREADITTQIAEAPRNATRAVQSLKELEKDIKFALPSSAVGEIDDNWTFDSLINEVAQEMQKDVDEKEELLKADGT